MIPQMESRPRLAPGCRFSALTGQTRMLMMPERALRLRGPSLQIVERCDGKHTVSEIVAELRSVYSKADPGKVEHDVLEYLERLQQERALDFD